MTEMEQEQRRRPAVPPELHWIPPGRRARVQHAAAYISKCCLPAWCLLALTHPILPCRTSSAAYTFFLLSFAPHCLDSLASKQTSGLSVPGWLLPEEFASFSSPSAAAHGSLNPYHRNVTPPMR